MPKNAGRGGRKKSVTNGGQTKRMTSSTQPMTSYKRKKEKTYSGHTIQCHANEINELIKKKEHFCEVPTF